MRREKGITLIALVITIIVLLILAGVAIAMLSGENGILKKAAEAKTKTEIAQKDEETKLTDMELTTEFVTNNLKYKCGNGYITGLTVDEKAKKLKDAIKILGYGLYDIEAGDEINDEDVLSTGLAVMKDGNTVAITILFGDTNNDGDISSTDSNAITAILNNAETANNLVEYKKVAMDVNHDGVINNNDATSIGDYLGENHTPINQDIYVTNASKITIESKN